MNEQGCWLLTSLNDRDWWRALMRLERAVTSDGAEVAAAYAELYRCLLLAGHASLPAALAHELLYGELAVEPAQLRHGSVGTALQLDLERLQELARTDWHQLAVARAGQVLPALTGLPSRERLPLQDLADRLGRGDLDPDWLHETYARQGQGRLSASLAWQLEGGELRPLQAPTPDRFESLYGLDAQLAELNGAVEPWLSGGLSRNVLLYGPRGSGKSTAARALLSHFSDRGLRMIEVPPRELTHVAELSFELSRSPLRFVLFVDDLAFSRSDSAWQRLKTLLDGSLQPLPANVMILATSNRRTLIRQRFGDRPDPLSADVHSWDTQDEQLAFADRFGLVITFPAADQRRYLRIVGKLAAERGLDGKELEEAALLFARRGNGMSGRTARQFVDTVSAP